MGNGPKIYERIALILLFEICLGVGSAINFLMWNIHVETQFNLSYSATYIVYFLQAFILLAWLSSLFFIGLCCYGIYGFAMTPTN